MNETVNINIAGLSFYIDKDAFQTLNHYFEAIKNSLSNTSGKEEVMKDIEMRVAELLIEKQKSDKHVINHKNIDEVIAIMGQPEDYRIDNDLTEPITETTFTNKRRKLYRDKDNGVIGGVCTGLGHYFGIDAVLIKIVFILLALTSFGVIAYLILWLAVPKAITTAEKLEMTGEPVTISTIEKKAREEFENISTKLKNTNYNKASHEISNFITEAFSVFIKVLGIFILIFSSFSIIGLFIFSFFIGSTTYVLTPWNNSILALNYTGIPLWAIGILIFLSLGIPIFFFILLGLKLLTQKSKHINNNIKYSLLGIWILSLTSLFFIGLKQSTESAFSGKSIIKKTLITSPNDTLYVKFVNNDFFSKNIYDNELFTFTQDSAKHEVIYSNNIDFELKVTDKKLPYLQIEKLANGKSYQEANLRAEKINYNFKTNGNQLLLDNFLLTEIANKYNGQRIEIYLYIPNGMFLKADKSVQLYSNGAIIESDSDENLYKIEANKIKCLNCPLDEDDTFGIEIDDTLILKKNNSIKINTQIIQTEKK